MTTSITHEFRLKHIVLLDDDQDLLAAWKEILESHDFLVSSFTNGAEALKLLIQMDVDIILCDLMMPTMAGDMFYLAVQKVKPHLCERFIFVTGYDKNPKFQPFLDRVKPTILYKPVTTGKLLGTISVLFSKKRPAPRPR